jgi:hypothetical protein
VRLASKVEDAMPLPASNRTKAGKRANAKFVMGEWKHGDLHSGSKAGPVIRDQKQAVAVMLSETGQAKPQNHMNPKKHKQI